LHGRFCSIWGTYYIGAARPDELVKALGIDSPILEVVVLVIALIGALAAGLTFLWKLLTSVRARLEAKRGDGKDRLYYRGVFASIVESRVRDLNNKEEWSDRRFTELEAEVETQGDSRRRRGLLGLVRRRGLRRERSLSRALRKSRERLILLQGDPGSGKSVALRFIARSMAAKAIDAKRLDQVIPLYVNLKELRPEGRKIDASLIEEFVLESVREGSDRDVYQFLEREFGPGKLDGTWFFLFDSFDEIPEVLSATEVDQTVQAYSDAISLFINGWSTCRGVIASRYFRAPPGYGLPTFHIVALSEKRKRKLIRKANLGDAEARLLEDLKGATPELAALSANPLFLGLLAEYVGSTGELPTGWHDVFEAFISKRLVTDREKVSQLFGIDEVELRQRSEEIAFTMTATEGLGLSPTRSELRRAYRAIGFGDEDRVEVALNALQWIKLARSESGGVSGTDPTFTFAHRRFQEYFATRVVLAEPGRVSARTLLTDANWRETAVTLCQAQPEQTEAIVAEASVVLAEAQGNPEDDSTHFTWKPGVLHVLSLLQSAFAGRTHSLPERLQRQVAEVLDEADRTGTLTDRKWALEVAGTAPAEVMERLLLEAFRGDSDWLREVAYRQVARLPRIPDVLAKEIRRALIKRTGDLRLQRDWSATRAQVMRLRPPGPFLRTARLLRVASIVDALAFALGFALLVIARRPELLVATYWALFAALGHASYYPVARSIADFRGIFSRAEPAAEGDDVSEVEAGASGSAPSRLGWMSMASFAGLEIRIMAVVFAVAAASTTDLFLPFLVCAYLAIWSIAATIVCLMKPPTVLGAVMAPFRLIPVTAQRLLATPPKRILFALGFLVAMALIVWGMVLLPHDIATVISYVFIPFAVLGALAAVAGVVSTWGRDQLWLWRWRRQEHTSMTAVDLLEALDELHTGANVARYLREVRTRRLLRSEPDARLAVRDILLLARRNGDEPDADEISFESSSFTAWGGEPSEIRGVVVMDGGAAADQLGQLLEDLERGEEVPVA
jgi:hypothetical protein